MARKYAGLHGCAHYYPDDYYAFALANDSWLNDCAIYMALKTANSMKGGLVGPGNTGCGTPPHWQSSQQSRKRRSASGSSLRYEFATQWKVKDYANARAWKSWATSRLSADSVDAWVGGELFEW